ncbi:MAG: helix-turn-helix domain-containing protein [Acidimicrobiales bacterium]
MASTLQGQWGANLRRLRKQRKLSQTALAQLVGMEPSHITRAEQGLANIGDERRIRLADALGVRVEDIWTYPTKVAS